MLIPPRKPTPFPKYRKGVPGPKEQLGYLLICFLSHLLYKHGSWGIELCNNSKKKKRKENAVGKTYYFLGYI